jgi:hypothetical protein
MGNVYSFNYIQLVIVLIFDLYYYSKAASPDFIQKYEVILCQLHFEYQAKNLFQKNLVW